MAAYEYRCRDCATSFEVRRPVSAPAASVRCPGGHDDVVRVWSAVAVTGGSRTGGPAPTPVAAGGGGCCGGGCCG